MPETECRAPGLHSLPCNLPADHMGPHMHIDSNNVTAWDLQRRTPAEGGDHVGE